MTQPAAPPEPAGPVERAGTLLLLALLTVLLTLWGAFLVPFRVGGTLVPVSWAVALAGNVVLGVWGGRLLGKAGSIAPMLLWLVIAVTLGVKRQEGDLVLMDPTPTYGFLLAGLAGGFVAYFVQVTRLKD